MNYHNITKCDMLNGPGIRVVLWVAGCPHHCSQCQNPETWNPAGGIPFDETAKEEIFSALASPYVEGITFSGGDPLMECNRSTVYDLLSEIKRNFPDKNVVIYTGYTYEAVSCLEIMEYADYVIDGRFDSSLRDTSGALHYRGSSNQRIIDVKQSRLTNRICTAEL